MLRFAPRDAQEPSKAALKALRPYEGVTARLLYSRGVRTAAQAEAFMHPSLGQLHDPMLLNGMAQALELLAQAKSEHWPTVVYGDYDVDGMCACALMTLALRRYGVDAQPHVPLRAEGYGLNRKAVAELAKTYRLMVTVDLGVTNHDEVKLAQSLGMCVIVTDHHGLALTPSPADAVMNPLLGGYPFDRLCGAGVAFKLAQALLGLEECGEYLDLAALATVADIVPLADENRALVALGLERIAARKRAGISALLTVSGDPSPVDAETLGFRLGPRLNAAGRLDDAGKGVRLLMTGDADEALRLATELDELNTRRKTAESQLVREAEKAAAGHDFISQPMLIACGEGWNTGVIGLAAGRLCQRYDCPVCVMSEQDGLLHGSLRSVPGVYIHRCLQACDDLLMRYGGHELAAGVTLAVENRAAFEQRLQSEVAKADPACFIPTRQYDAEVVLDDCTDALMDELSRMAPYGCGNPAPMLYARGLAPEERRAVGAEGAHLKLSMRQGKRVLGGIAFGMGGMASALGDRVDALFSLGRNTFRGVTTLQMDVKALAPSGGQAQDDMEGAQAALLDALAAACGESAQGGKACDDGLPSRSQSDMRAGLPDAAASRAPLAPETWAALEAAYARQPRGMLLISRTPESARRALMLGELDTVARAPADPRCFATLVTSPVMGMIEGCWRQVWLLDGEMRTGEAKQWRRQLPTAEVHALDDAQALQVLAQALDAGDAAYRQLYKALKTTLVRSLNEAAQAAGLGRQQARLGLRAFDELRLIACEETPFRYTLLPPVKCRLGDSPTLGAVRALAGARRQAAAQDAGAQAGASA